MRKPELKMAPVASEAEASHHRQEHEHHKFGATDLDVMRSMITLVIIGSLTVGVTLHDSGRDLAHERDHLGRLEGPGGATVNDSRT